jgi:hypothetical protein
MRFLFQKQAYGTFTFTRAPEYPRAVPLMEFFICCQYGACLTSHKVRVPGKPTIERVASQLGYEVFYGKNGRGLTICQPCYIGAKTLHAPNNPDS